MGKSFWGGVISLGWALSAHAQPCDVKFAKTKFCGELHWREAPSVEQKGSFELQWRKRGAAAPTAIDPPGELEIKLFMPAMGHGSAPVEIKRLAPGQFEVSRVHFLMKGLWQIQFRLRREGKTLDEAVVSVDVPASARP